MSIKSGRRSGVEVIGIPGAIVPRGARKGKARRRARRGPRTGAHAAATPWSCRVAIRAPSASASSFAHWMLGCTRRTNAPWAKPQSVPRHHSLRPDQPREPDEALGDELRVLDDVRVVGDDAGDEHLAVRQLDVLPQPPLVLVARVGLLDQVVAGAHLEDEVDHVGERRVVHVGAVPAAEADVVADALLGDVPQRVVERLDRAAPPSAGSPRPSRRARGSSRTRA